MARGGRSGETQRAIAGRALPAEAAPGGSPSHSLAQIAYARLRAAIADGTLSPGQRLMELQVSAWLRISRTPAREALRRLEADGLLEYGPSGGLSVASYDGKAVKELYDIRESLEGSAAALAARNAGAYEIETLQARLRVQASLPRDVASHARENRLFHTALYQAAHNRFLLRSMQSLQDAMLLLGEKNFSVPGRIESSIEEHGRIVAAVAARDPEAAEEAGRLHIRHGYASRIRAMTDEIDATAPGRATPPAAARPARRSGSAR